MCSQLRSDVVTIHWLEFKRSYLTNFRKERLWLDWARRPVGRSDNVRQIVLPADFLGFLILALRSAEKPSLSWLSADALISERPTGRPAGRPRETVSSAVDLDSPRLGVNDSDGQLKESRGKNMLSRTPTKTILHYYISVKNNNADLFSCIWKRSGSNRERMEKVWFLVELFSAATHGKQKLSVPRLLVSPWLFVARQLFIRAVKWNIEMLAGSFSLPVVYVATAKSSPNIQRASDFLPPS